MLILEKLQTEKFSDSQQSVVDYILKHKKSIKNMTVREIAKAAYTSNATLIRIAHKLHYSGWEEFKSDFLKEQEYLNRHFTKIDANIPFTKHDTLESIAHKVAELKKESINDTLQLLDENDLAKAGEILRNAEIINVIGINNTLILAQQFALKLGRINKMSFAHDPGGEVRYNHMLLRKNSCCIVISYSGESNYYMREIRNMKRAGVPVIAITSIGENSVAKEADVTLRMCTREKLYSKISWYTTETSINYILDLLYSVLFWEDFDKNIEYKFSVSREIEHARIASSNIIIEENEKLD